MIVSRTCEAAASPRTGRRDVREPAGAFAVRRIHEPRGLPGFDCQVSSPSLWIMPKVIHRQEISPWAGPSARSTVEGMTHTLAAGDDLPQAQHDPQQPTLVIRAGSPGALLRLIPHLLGFVPEASLVVIGVG